MKRRPRRILGFLARLVLWILAATLFLVLPLRWLPPVTTSFMVQNWFAQKSWSAQIDYEWVSRPAINRHAPLAVLAAEDQKFFQHPGFDREAIEKAFRRSRDGIYTRGGSTISQQLAKNLWLWPERSWFRKGLEAYLTVWIELLWPKERILELYLNVAQFGPHLFGVEAAAQEYFGKSAARLNRPEAARLAAVLPNPARFHADRPSRYVLRRQAWIERQSERLAPILTERQWKTVR